MYVTSIKDYLLLDEVQFMSRFEEVLNSLLRISNIDVYVTGSNSKFLSSDIVAGVRYHDRYHTGFFYSGSSVLWSKGKRKSEMRGGEKLYHDSTAFCDCTCGK